LIVLSFAGADIIGHTWFRRTQWCFETPWTGISIFHESSTFKV